MKKSIIGIVCVGSALLFQTPILWSKPAAPPLPSGKTVNVVRDYGADNTGAAYATQNIQNAINACQSGDTLLIPPGKYLLNNGLTLKSGITVNLSKEALLQANTLGVWTDNRSPILSGKGLDHITIQGGGKIDGGGLVYIRHRGTEPGRGVQLVDCTNIIVRGISVSNIPNFAVDFANSENLTVTGLTIRGRGFDNLEGSADGMDIEGCVNADVSNCNIEVGDDALCLKTVDGQHPCHAIRVRNCTLASTCNAFKIGTGTVGDVYDVVADTITVNKHANPGHGNPVPSGDCIAAIALESNDHHRTHDIICRNFTITSCYCPIYIELQNRQSYEKGTMGRLDTVLIENVNCLKALQPIIFNWQPGEPNKITNKITNVTLSHVTVHNAGTDAGAPLTPMTGNYPDANKNGKANAYGIWARGLDGLTLKECRFYDDGASKRQKFVFDPTTQNIDAP